MVFDRPDYCFDSEHLTGMVTALFRIDRLSNLGTAMIHKYVIQTNKCQNYNYAFIINTSRLFITRRYSGNITVQLSLARRAGHVG